MSKDRARRRAVVQAEREEQRLVRERERRRAARIDRLRPRVPRVPRLFRRRRGVKVWTRRTRTQRAAVVAIGFATIVLTMLFIESWPIRLAVFALVAIGTPALSTLAMGRSRG